ncbi:hypothetical protein U1Q18_000413 [Sarracenia purpurea var. burkii]
MPDHHLHAYFRFLVDHPELLQSNTDEKPETERKGNAENNQTDGVGAGALFLLGSVYGSGEDEDAIIDGSPEFEEIVSGKSFGASGATVSHGSGKSEISGNVDAKDEAIAKNQTVSKEKPQILKRNSFTSAPKFGTTNSTKLSAVLNKSQPSAPPNMSQVEQLILEPPSDLKRLVDKIVEFILRNGKQFEVVLTEQDAKHGRFPFLLPSNQYHPYYVKVLQKAQESKLIGKSFLPEKKDDSVVIGQGKRTHLPKESDSLSSGSAGYDMSYDADRKEKFRMVIGKSKKDGQDLPSKAASQPQFGVNVDAAAAAAILQAATRGIKNTNFGILSSSSLNGRNSEMASEQKGDHSVPVPAAKAIAKTAALEAANEADSTEAHMTKEQKLKAERLKRAKMFVAMLKSGAEPLKTESLRSLSVEPQETWFSGSADGVINLAGKEREGISVPLDVNISERKEKSEKKYSDEYNERKSKRKYRSRSNRYGEEEEDEDEDEDEEVEDEDQKHSRKKHRSHRSSYEGSKEHKEERDHRYTRKKHRSYHSSHEEDREGEEEEEEGEWDHKHSQKKHRSYRSPHEDYKEEDYKEERHHKHSRKKHRSHSSSRHGKDRHKQKERHHSSSKNKESRHRQKHVESSSDDERWHHSSSNKHRKISHSEEELEEGEISSKILDQSRGSVGAGISREASIDLSSSGQDRRAPSQPSETTEVSDELRAKIRAMLMATL